MMGLSEASSVIANYSLVKGGLYCFLSVSWIACPRGLAFGAWKVGSTIPHPFRISVALQNYEILSPIP